MSALARYYRHEGYTVAGYDRTPSDLTHALEAEGISICYEDNPTLLPFAPEGLTVVWTPAVPKDTRMWQYLSAHGAHIQKRAEALGAITATKKALCVAGTHGKTTTSTILAHLLTEAISHWPLAIGKSMTAFLGGISENYHTNYYIANSQQPMANGDEYVVVEADEFDRSFHHLRPYMTVVTSVDPDHLDIYGTPEAYRESFEHYISLVQDTIVLKYGLQDILHLPAESQEPEAGSAQKRKLLTYSAEDTRADYYASDIITAEGSIRFDLHHPHGVIRGIQLGVPVWVNIENSIAAAAVFLQLAFSHWPLADGRQQQIEEVLREGLASFAGVHRRFNIHVKTPQVVYIDDYAHHPQEIASSILSVRKLYPERHLIGIFQPHLYTRTRDFADGFAEVLATLDEVILLPIYPAREMPIAGVDSEMLLRLIESRKPQAASHSAQACVMSKEELLATIGEHARQKQPVAVLTIGAGDIDRLVGAIAQELNDLAN